MSEQRFTNHNVVVGCVLLVLVNEIKVSRLWFAIGLINNHTVRERPYTWDHDKESLRSHTQTGEVPTYIDKS